MNNSPSTSILDTLEKTTPHLDSQRPYGYRFHAISVYIVDGIMDVDIYEELKETHRFHDIQIGENNPHQARFIWEIARHIEGNFGLPYGAIFVVSRGTISIYTIKGEEWWNNERWSELSGYLMGLRSMIDLLPK